MNGPSQWPRVALDQLCTIEKGGINPQKESSRGFAHYSIPAYDGGLGPQIEQGAAIKSQKTMISNDVVLVSKLNPRIPRVWLVDDEQEHGRICSTEFVPLRADRKRIESHYLAFALQHSLTTDEITGSTSAATKSRERAKPTDFLRLKIPLPPLPEQRRLVDILSRAEGIVRLRCDAQKKAAELMPALFLNMFGDPATNPKGWPVCNLGELLAEPPTLGTMAKPSSKAADWLDLRVANIQVGRLALDDKKWTDLPDGQVNRFALRDGDIVLARAIGSRDHLGKAVVVYPGESKWTFDSHLMRIRVDKSRLLPEMLKGFLESAGGREAFLKHTRRSAVQFNINGKELRLIAMPLVPLSLQLEYLAQGGSIAALQSQQTDALRKADEIFDALLSRTFAAYKNG